MNRLQAFIFLLFAVSLATGVMVGMGLARAPRNSGGSWLGDELQLTTAQQDEMRKIWETVRGEQNSIAEKRRPLSKKRDDEILALIPQEEKHSYDLIVEHFSQQVAELNRDRDAAVEAGIANTMKILDPTQQEKYKALVNQGFRTPRARPTDTRAATSRPTTQPTRPTVQP